MKTCNKPVTNKVNNLKTFANSRLFTNIEKKLEDYSVNSSNNYWKSIKDLLKNYKTPDSIPVLKRTRNDFQLSLPVCPRFSSWPFTIFNLCK